MLRGTLICPCGSPAISWTSGPQKIHGYSGREDDQTNKIEIGLVLNWVVRRHSVPEIRAPSLRGSQPHVPVQGFWNQPGHAKSDPPTSPNNATDRGRKQDSAQAWTNRLTPSSHELATQRHEIGLDQQISPALLVRHGTTGCDLRITIRPMTSQVLPLPVVAVPITPDPDFTGS